MQDHPQDSFRDICSISALQRLMVMLEWSPALAIQEVFLTPSTGFGVRKHGASIYPPTP
jgi:hypothetical protein